MQREWKARNGDVFVFVVFEVDEVWECRKGNGINQIDVSGGGKMIRITINKATLMQPGFSYFTSTFCSDIA